MEKTRIVLIYPRGGDTKQGIPFAFGYLKSNTDNGEYDIRIVDCTLDDLDPGSLDFTDRIKQIDPHIIGVTSWSFNFPEALRVLRLTFPPKTVAL